MSGIKSSFCNGATSCAEVEDLGNGIIEIRNTGNLSTGVLVTLGEWLAFIEGVKAGEFDGIGQGPVTGVQVDALPETITA